MGAEVGSQFSAAFIGVGVITSAGKKTGDEKDGRSEGLFF
jgi:hypothetical protein